MPKERITSLQLQNQILSGQNKSLAGRYESLAAKHEELKTRFDTTNSNVRKVLTDVFRSQERLSVFVHLLLSIISPHKYLLVPSTASPICKMKPRYQ